MGDWRYIAARLNGDGTETILDTELPLEDVSMTKALSGPAGLQASIAPALSRLIGPDGQPIIRPWSTGIFAEESGEIRHGVIVSDLTKDGAKLSITGVGFTAAIKDQPYTGEGQFFIQTDPLDIVRHIWDHWQSFRGGDLGLQLDRGTKAGVLIGTELRQVEFDSQAGPVSFEAGPFKLNDYETDDLGGKVDALARDYSFDYVESHSWNAAGDGFDHRLDFGAPRIGRRRTDLRFVVGENVVAPPPETLGGDSYLSGLMVRGAGEGSTMNRALVERAQETRLRRIGVITDNTLKSATAVRARGAELLPRVDGNPEITEIAVRDSSAARLGSWVEGDEIELLSDSPWGGEPMWVRILSTTISPAAPNVAGLSVVRADKIPT